MLKNEAQSRRARLVMASTLTMMTLTYLNFPAVAAPPNSKTLTPEQFRQMRDSYVQYQRSVQLQLQQKQAATQQQKQLLEQQEQQRLSQQAADSTNPPKTAKLAKPKTPIPRQDVLLLMPAKGAKAEDITAAIENADGEICGGLGAGGLSVILVKAKPGKVVQLQRKLAADSRDFLHVDYNRESKADFIPVTEPTFSKSWHLTQMHVPDAWDVAYTHRQIPSPIAVFDSGVTGPEPWLGDAGADCTGKVGNDKESDLNLDGFLGTGLFADKVQDKEVSIARLGAYIKANTLADMDTHGHGTWVACTIDGNPFNGLGSAGINPMVPVVPIRIANGPAGTEIKTDDLALIKAMCVVYDMPEIRIINISYGTMMSAKDHSILHEFFKDFYNRKNGLVFCSAGNNGENLSMANQPYILCVSAMAQKDGIQIVNKANTGGGWASATGRAVDFTAPGQNIEVCDPSGKSDSVDGTSFSSPICAAIASMIWTVNPNLKNTQVLQIMIDSCTNNPPGAGSWNPQFGWGMPDALKCVNEAAGK